MFRKIKDFTSSSIFFDSPSESSSESGRFTKPQKSGLSFEKMTNSNFPSFLHSLKRDSVKENENIVYLYL